MEKEEELYLAWSTWLRCGARVRSGHKNDKGTSTKRRDLTLASTMIRSPTELLI